MSTEDKIAEYVKKDGVSCMNCDYYYFIEGIAFPEIIEGEAHQRVRCTDCDSEWIDIYSLTDVASVGLTGEEG